MPERIELTEHELNLCGKIAVYFNDRDTYRKRDKRDYFQMAALAALSVKKKRGVAFWAAIKNGVVDQLRQEDGRASESLNRWANAVPFCDVEKRQAVVSEAAGNEELDFGISIEDWRQSSIEQVDRKLDCERILYFIDQTTNKRDAQLFKLRFLERKSFKASGASVGLAESSALIIINNILKRLQERFKGERLDNATDSSRTETGRRKSA